MFKITFEDHRLIYHGCRLEPTYYPRPSSVTQQTLALKSYTDLFMRNITTGYCIKAHVELNILNILDILDIMAILDLLRSRVSLSKTNRFISFNHSVQPLCST